MFNTLNEYTHESPIFESYFMKKATKLLIILLGLIIISCSSDDNDCPEELIVDINDPESLARAEECGLSPAGPLGESTWVYRLE